MTSIAVSTNCWGRRSALRWQRCGLARTNGVATYIGTLLGIAPLFVLVFAAVWLAMAFVFRYSSLAALTAMLVIPVVLWIFGAEKVAAVMAIMSVISYFKHKTNISRLMNGTESKIGAKG